VRGSLRRLHRSKPSNKKKRVTRRVENSGGVSIQKGIVRSRGRDLNGRASEGGAEKQPASEAVLGRPLQGSYSWRREGKDRSGEL